MHTVQQVQTRLVPMFGASGRVRENHHDHKSCHRVMINDRVMRGPNVIRFDRYTYLGKVDRVA